MEIGRSSFPDLQQVEPSYYALHSSADGSLHGPRFLNIVHFQM